MEYILGLAGLVVIVSAAGVVAFKNVIHSAIALICNLVGVAVFYALMNAHFLAIAQIIVYAGAVVILLLFAIMLLGAKVEVFRKGEFFFQACVILMTLFFGLTLIPALIRVFSGLTRPQIPPEGTVTHIGLSIFSNYVLQFQMAGILLLAALIGVMLVAYRSYKGGDHITSETQNSGGQSQR